MAERSLRLGTLQEFHTPLGAVESSSERQSGEANDSGRASRPEADATRSTALSLLILDGEKALAEAVARALLLEQGIRSATGMSDPEAARSAIELGQLDVVVVGT